ncbi:conserved Plasmodium protein, unknown function [Plasmodium vivax]|uniref:Uncharacterized protein n=1 Tax=Plasmodium vivax (strain Salvador I) TaxID=126793 RepID=A5K2X6_PLAVS|nr:hypothetical protein, conserved [Plasmodium vivax]EDL45880.1 hypothetical protein, conserved [Plasmodium vivax]CAI7722091.1 conserved Plasmodium protein, unknown function [Plasmodium vivax]|eukprot:XP_001615607.1 hypothetical protein [Plasmodium vivax Sal-1]
MGEAKRAGLLAEKKQDEGATGAANKNILFKECKHANEFRETFINVETDYSLDSEKEKNNIPLLKVFKKKLREEKACTRALITFQTSKEESRRSCLKEHLLKVLKQDHNRVITGACIFVHGHSIMLLESLETKKVFSFVRQLNGVKDVAGVQVLYFSELNKKSVTDDFAFFHYNKEQPKGAPLSGECNYVDEVWELYINTLQFCCLAKNSAERQGIFDRNENIKKNFALLPHLYSDAARQYVWTADEFISFFMKEFQLPVDDFSDDFLDL